MSIILAPTNTWLRNVMYVRERTSVWVNQCSHCENFPWSARSIHFLSSNLHFCEIVGSRRPAARVSLVLVRVPVIGRPAAAARCEKRLLVLPASAACARAEFLFHTFIININICNNIYCAQRQHGERSCRTERKMDFEFLSLFLLQNAHFVGSSDYSGDGRRHGRLPAGPGQKPLGRSPQCDEGVAGRRS